MDEIWASAGQAVSELARLSTMCGAVVLVAVLIWALTVRAQRERREVLARRRAVLAYVEATRTPPPAESAYPARTMWKADRPRRAA